MATNRKPARKKSKGRAGSSAGRGKIFGVIVTIVAIAAALAFLRVNHITSINAAIDYFRGASNETSRTIRGSGLDKKLSNICNFVEDASCLYDKDVQAKIGDVNNDGKIDNADSDEYAMENGVTEGGSAGSKQSEATRADSLSTADPSGDAFKAAEWPHWTIVSGQCDARELVMKNAGLSVDSKCRPTGGSVTDPFTGGKISDISDITVDYVIPLKYAEQHGGASWSPDQKRAYANDGSLLLAVSRSASDDRGDKGPDEWTPSDKSYACEYVNRWIDTALKYDLTVTARDKIEMQTVLKTCSE
jgi:hypothetical protein